MHQVAMGSGASHPFIIPLTKIDVARRLVIGTAAEEVEDKSREIMDYATARPQFEAWSKSFSDATGGLSKGNLRVMHTKTVAGRLDQIAYDDETRKVQIVAKVVDDNEWEKCLSGSYTGFSIGGGYLKKWQDPGTGLTRYTPIVREISLVDNPCMPTATFAELVKADGMVTQLQLHGVVRSFADQWAERPVAFGEAWAMRPRTFADLAKRASWSESLHPRAENGEFGAGQSEPEPAPKQTMRQRMFPSKAERSAKQAAQEAEDKAEDARLEAEQARLDALPKRHNEVMGEAEGAAGGAFVGRAALNDGPALVQNLRFGFGEKGLRNATAANLRSKSPMPFMLRLAADNKDPPVHNWHRQQIIGKARRAREGVLADYRDANGEGGTLVNAARRKVIEEAVMRGSSAEEAHAAGEKFATKLAGRKDPKTVGELYRDGVPTRRVSPKAAVAAQRAAQHSLRGQIRQHGYESVVPGPILGRGMKQGVWRMSAAQAVLGGPGGILGEQSAYRLAHEANGEEVSTGHAIAATAGDGLRTLARGGIAGLAGNLIGSFGNAGIQYARHKGRISAMNQPAAHRAGRIGGRIGLALGIATSAPHLIREYAARYGSKET